jgi:hypothetical protein
MRKVIRSIEGLTSLLSKKFLIGLGVFLAELLQRVRLFFEPGVHARENV